MPYAREAAAFAVRQLLPTDRVSVTIFDDEVKTIVPNAPAVDKPRIFEADRAGATPAVRPTSTAAGPRGARQAETHRVGGGLNRVLLLSDGLANVGITDPNVHRVRSPRTCSPGASRPRPWASADEYNEDLMEAVAKAGDGHYYYIESSVQLVDIFQTELEGLMATPGAKRSASGSSRRRGRVVSDVLNDFEKSREPAA